MTSLPLVIAYLERPPKITADDILKICTFLKKQIRYDSLCELSVKLEEKYHKIKLSAIAMI